MWIFLNDSFLSIVQDTNDPKGMNLLVRARKKGDIERVFTDAVVSESGSDYAYRASIFGGTVTYAISKAIRAIDYPNFKDSVKDDARHFAYLRVWTEMWKWQDEIAVRRPRKKKAAQT